MEKVFTSMRKAACWDCGALGTLCRLKMMELIELRAMHWRPNLSHTKYYLNRAQRFSEAAGKGGHECFFILLAYIFIKSD